jgi:hypothetical protein
VTPVDRQHLRGWHDPYDDGGPGHPRVYRGRRPGAGRGEPSRWTRTRCRTPAR